MFRALASARRSVASVGLGRLRYSTEINGCLSKTATSVLPNGLTVASESLPNTNTATVGIFVDTGSRAENEKNNGTAHFWSI